MIKFHSLTIEFYTNTRDSYQGRYQFKHSQTIVNKIQIAQPWSHRSCRWKESYFKIVSAAHVENFSSQNYNIFLVSSIFKYDTGET